MSPSTAAVLDRQLSLALDGAKQRGDILEMQRILGVLTALVHTQFGSPANDGAALPEQIP